MGVRLLYSVLPLLCWNDKQLGRKGLFWCPAPGGGHSLSWQQEHEASLAVRKQTRQEMEPGYKTSKYLQEHTSSSKAAPPKGSMTFANTAASWRPRVQILVPVGDIYHSDDICTLALS